MFGIFLTSFASFFTEVSDSIGKQQVSQYKQSIFTMIFLQLFCGTIIYVLIFLVKPESFVFSFASLPFFVTRIFLELVQSYSTVRAITFVDRSTFSFIRIGTIPLLAIVDFFIGYQLSLFKLAGIGIIVFTLLFVFINRNIKKTGVGWVIFSTLNAVITLSLYKYDITNFNSVLAEQLIVYLISLIFFAVCAFVYGKENPFSFLKQRISLTQSLTNGLGGVIDSFAYGFAPASVITAAKRSSAALWAIAAGRAYFKEKHILIKVAVGFFLILGLVALVL